MTRLYVGNLPYSTNDASLKDLFSQFGNVVSANVIVDRNSGRSKGFGFVEFDSEETANAAIEGLNGKELDGRAVVVSVARPKEETPRRPQNRNRY